jgi:hypothetical protein
MRTTLAVLLILASLLDASLARGAPALAGKVAARIAVTMDTDDTGTIHVPSPFSIVPGTGEIVLVVPESDGIFLLRGKRILHHFPLPVAHVHDVDVSSKLLVTGRRPETGRVTADMEIFDFPTRRRIERVQSANPFLRVEGPGHEFWRVVLGGDRVGIYQPSQGATYPLWVRDAGIVASAEQVALASPGIGWGGEVAWVPLFDGSVSRMNRGRSEPMVDAGNGEFLGAIGDASILVLSPSPSVRVDSDGEFLLDRDLQLRWQRVDGATREFRIATTSSDVRAEKIVVRGQPARVRDDSLYWIFAGYDYLEIRTLPLAEVLGPDFDGSR